VDKNTFYGQMSEADKDQLVGLTADNFHIQVTEVNGEVKLLMTPNVDPAVAAAAGDVIETEWAAQNP